MRASLLVSVALLAAAALSACKREATFDERYAGAEKAIRQKAGELDRDMAKRAADEQVAQDNAARPAPSAT